jgi:hypothetical protein
MFSVVPYKEDTEELETSRADRDRHTGTMQVLTPRWIIQPKLMQATGYCRGQPVNDLFFSVQAELEAATTVANFEVASSTFMDAFRKHLDEMEQFHLGFSAAIPAFFSALRKAEKVANLSAGSEAPGIAFCRCATLVRSAMSSSRFGKSPPRKKPADVTRSQYIRELSAHAGLCLDLARLAFVHKKHLKGKRRSAASGRNDETAQPLMPFHSTPPHLRAKAEIGDIDEEQDLKSPGDVLQAESVCVGHDELRDCLAQAGKYLQAVQMDMDRHHDEAAAQVRRAKEARKQVTDFTDFSEIQEALEEQISGGDTSAKLETSVDPEGIESQRSLKRSLSSEELSREEEEKVLALIASASGSSDSRPEDSAAEASQESSFGASTQRVAGLGANADPDAVDPLLTPTFGEFLMRQLLPLYIADVPFLTLRHLAESFCGIPLDEDDERKAWKVLGLQMPQRAPTKKRPSSRQPSPGGASVASSSSTVPTSQSQTQSSSPLPTGPTLAALCEVMEKPAKATMRQQMHTSIVEKRRKEFKAPRDMDTAIFRRSRHAVPAASPVIRPSAALLQSPAVVGELSRMPLPSPVSMRRAPRGRLELLSSVRSTASTRLGSVRRGRSRSPRLSVETPRVRASPSHPAETPVLHQTALAKGLDWHLLDTPAR